MALRTLREMFDAGEPPPMDPAETSMRAGLAELRSRAKANPSRELSLAITNLEQSILWLRVSNGSVT